MKACTYDNFDIAELILKHGADPNIESKKGYTALTCAERRNYTDIVKLLLSHGAEE